MIHVYKVTYLSDTQSLTQKFASFPGFLILLIHQKTKLSLGVMGVPLLEQIDLLCS